MTPVIIDIVIAAILLLMLFIGTKRGLFRAMAGLVILVLSLAGASLIARSMTPVVSEWIYPVWEQRISQQVENTVEQQVPEKVQDLLNLFDADFLQQIENAGSAVIGSATREIFTSLLNSVLYLVSFILLMLILHLLAHAIDLMLKLPVLRDANSIGGAIVGLIEGVLLVYLLLWLAARFGHTFSSEGTYLLHFFQTYTPSKWLAYL